jgi:hypothetical protein
MPSGTITFNPVVSDIVGRALNLLGVQAAGEVLDSNNYSTGLDFLNMLVKYWQTKGIGLWTMEQTVLFLQNGQAIYQLGNNSSDLASTEWVVTTLAATPSGGATQVVLSTLQDPIELNSPMLVGDNIGFVNGNVIYWTTISAINTSNNTVTINGTIPMNSSIQAGTFVYTYRALMPRPMEIKDVHFKNNSQIDFPCEQLSRMDYEQYTTPKNLTTSIVLKYYFEIQETDSFIHLWPVPSDITGQIRFTSIRRLDDFDNVSDTADFPQEWIMPLVYNLAMFLAPVYNKELKVNTPGPASIGSMAKTLLDDAMIWDEEAAPLFIRPRIEE